MKDDFLSNKVCIILPQHDFITDSLLSNVEVIGTKICSIPWRLLTFSTIFSKWDPTVRATLKTVSRLWSLSWQHVRTGISSFSASSAMKKRYYYDSKLKTRGLWRFSFDSINDKSLCFLNLVKLWENS